MDASFAKREPFNAPVGPRGQTGANRQPVPRIMNLAGKGGWIGTESRVLAILS